MVGAFFWVVFMTDVLTVEVDELDPAFEKAIVEDAPHVGVEDGTFLVQEPLFLVADTLHDVQQLIIRGPRFKTP
jgi:hypothetical protein